DPINGCDPSGLFPPLLLFLGAKALGLGIAAAGAYGSAAVADKIKSKRDKKDSSSAVDAMNKVAPIVAAISGASTVPGLMTMAPGAITAAGQRIGAALTTSQHGGKVIKTAQAIEGFVNPNAPTTLAVPGLVGTGAARAKSIYDEWRNQ
ncbi:hypothetical protein LJB93_01060, partial [Desulfovibrio sp. OttesenSCG-928-F07]|nr:hypothetical protein [Desulfovibrio sp. OttesenSCG-928-F07]